MPNTVKATCDSVSSVRSDGGAGRRLRHADAEQRQQPRAHYLAADLCDRQQIIGGFPDPAQNHEYAQPRACHGPEQRLPGQRIEQDLRDMKRYHDRNAIAGIEQ